MILEPHCLKSLSSQFCDAVLVRHFQTLFFLAYSPREYIRQLLRNTFSQNDNFNYALKFSSFSLNAYNLTYVTSTLFLIYKKKLFSFVKVSTQLPTSLEYSLHLFKKYNETKLLKTLNIDNNDLNQDSFMLTSFSHHVILETFVENWSVILAQ